MKKTVALLALVLVIIISVSVPVFAEDIRTAEAPKGTITVDGVVDSVWGSAPKIVADREQQGKEPTISAYAKTLWDENYFYVLVEVTDEELDNEAGDVWERDCVELYFGEFNSRKGDLQILQDWQTRFHYDGTVNDSILDMKSVTKLTDDGYRIEVAIPWTDKTRAAEGTVVGFDLQANDTMGAGGGRQSIIKWSDTEDNGWQDTTLWGQVNLVGAAAPQTGDSGMLIYFVLAVAAITVIIISKKIKIAVN